MVWEGRRGFLICVELWKEPLEHRVEECRQATAGGWGREEVLLVRWSEDCSVLRSSSGWQLVLLDWVRLSTSCIALSMLLAREELCCLSPHRQSGKKHGGFQWVGCPGTG